MTSARPRTAWPRVVAALVLFVMGVAPDLEAQTATVRGTVSGPDQEPLSGVLVSLWSEGREVRRVITSEAGTFQMAGSPADTYEIRASRLGYTEFRAPLDLTAGGVAVSDIVLRIAALFGDTLVVSVSRQPEKAVSAPASVSIVGDQAIEARPVIALPEHIKNVPAVDVASVGLIQSRIAVRGFNNALSTFDKTLVLVDNRNTHVPALRHNLSQLLPTQNADIDRIEVVRGPGSALYGANAANGVVHIITKSPFESPGTIATVGVGERDLRMAAVRHASVLSDRVAFKLSGQVLEGTDWEFFDPAEPDSVLLGKFTLDGRVNDNAPIDNTRDFEVENYRVDGRMDFRGEDDLLVVLSAGAAQQKNLNITDVGGGQNQDWRYLYGQARVSRGRLFAQAFLNATDTEDSLSYLRRTGDRIVDKSKLFVAQLQHGGELWDGRQDFTYGADLYLTRPNTDFTIHGRFEDDDDVNLFGVYLQSETRLDERLSLVATARVDDHNALPDLIFSPRAALVYELEDNHSLRATYNRAFTTPSSPQLFLDLNLGQLGPLPFGLRGLRSPDTGYRFMRGADTGVGGFFMQSPFNAGGASEFIPADGTRLWSSVVAILGAQGVDISGIPAPTAADVSSVLGILNAGTGAFDPLDPTALTDIGPPEPGITNSFEVGYRGVFDGRWFLTADAYYSDVENFVSTLDVQTPNVFLDPTSLANYLSGFMATEDATALAAGIGAIPLGTVTPVEAGELNPADLILTFRNFKGDDSFWGTDLSVAFYPDARWSFGLAYSHVSEDLFERGPEQLQDIALNAPTDKVAANVGYRDADLGLDTGLRFRWVDSFPVLSGVFQGTVDAYTVFDLNAAWTVPFAPDATLQLSIQNLFDNEHFEYVGTPQIGRLAMLQLSYAF